MNPDDADFWIDEQDRRDDELFGDEKTEEPMSGDESTDKEIARLLSLAEEIDHCCRQGCRGCDKLMPEATIEPDKGNEPPF